MVGVGVPSSPQPTILDAFGRVLVVVYVYREPATIRIISARKADASERKQYET
jgi:uncharacterized DUF497 family protein